MKECPNRTETEFYISAFSTSVVGEHVLFGAVLLMYLFTVNGNVIITALICLAPQLHTPMYFFLCNLSIADIMYVSSTVPKLLYIMITQDKMMSLSACITQIHFYMLSGLCDILTLTCMSYDRYVAVCKPLQYSMIMSKRLCIILAASSWLVSAINSLIYSFLTSLLEFCSSHNINHFYCDLKILYTVSISDTRSREILMIFENIFCVLLPFSLTITSYVYIISCILKIHSALGRSKSFSNCTSHLTTVVVFYGPIIFLYGKPQSENDSDQDKLLSLLYMVVVPMLNPIIYTLRNRDVLDALTKITKIKRDLLFM